MYENPSVMRGVAWMNECVEKNDLSWNMMLTIGRFCASWSESIGIKHWTRLHFWIEFSHGCVGGYNFNSL